MSDTNSKPREWVIGAHTILVDAEDYPLLSRFTWHVIKIKQAFYAATSVRIGEKKFSLKMHRLITGMRAGQIDHKNHNGLDNRKVNLRYATAAQNSANHRRPVGKYGYRGVTICGGKFTAQCKPGGKFVRSGRFETAIEAAKEYDRISKIHFGEFAFLNFPEDK